MLTGTLESLESLYVNDNPNLHNLPLYVPLLRCIYVCSGVSMYVVVYIYVDRYPRVVGVSLC